jgi:eukaryotic-like serine/threonine-protein kinase
VIRTLRILVVSDDSQVGRWLQHRVETLRADCALTPESYEAFERRLASSGTDEFDAVFAVLDFDPEQSAASFAWLDRIKGVPGSTQLVVVAENGDELCAVQCVRRGAIDYLPRKLISNELLDSAVSTCIQALPRPVAPVAASGTARTRGDPALLRALKVPRDLIPRYMLLDTLGESQRATVYLAHSAALNRNVALKVSRVAENEEAQFAREYEAVGAISHQNVVDIYDYGMHESREFIAMEYFPCGDLKARLQNPVSETEALDYLHRIAAALCVVHAQGVLHRDLKPPNIMLREDGQVVLIDFGLAKSIVDATRSTAAGVLRGSPYYMSPEQAQGTELDGRSDLYSLGVIFHEMLTGSKPYLGATAVEVLQQHVSAPLPLLAPELARHQPLLEGLMAKSRDDRFPTADALLTHLRQQQAA